MLIYLISKIFSVVIDCRGSFRLGIGVYNISRDSTGAFPFVFWEYFIIYIINNNEIYEIYE